MLNVLNNLREAYAAITSKTAQRTLLNTVLITFASVFLWVLAVVAYSLFYYNYLPSQVTTVPIHLQYGRLDNPVGISSLVSTNLKDSQNYDLSVVLTLPRSPSNLALGNFMLGLYVTEADKTLNDIITGRKRPDAGERTSEPALDPQLIPGALEPLFFSLRATLVPYTDPVVTTISRFLLLPYHLAFPADAETIVLRVPMGERVVFPRIMRQPQAVLEVFAGRDIQLYSAEMVLTARLGGLRWAMYHHRVLSFMTMTTLFWACEMFCAVAAWGILAVLYDGLAITGNQDPAALPGQAGAGDTTGRIKAEPDDMSDTERTFPSTSKQQPIKYEGRPKTEEAVDPSAAMADIPTAVTAPGAEADDEDEDDEEEGEDVQGGFRDSGIGTSYSENQEGQSVRRRASKSGRAANR